MIQGVAYKTASATSLSDTASFPGFVDSASTDERIVHFSTDVSIIWIYKCICESYFQTLLSCANFLE